MGSVRIQNVTKQYGGRIVLDDISLVLDTGRIVGLVGPNGAGKTTLFKMMTGHIAPDMGTVTRSRGLEVGYLPQEPILAADATMHDEVLSAFADVLALEKKQHDLSDAIAAHRNDAELQTLMTELDRVNAQFETAGGYEIEQRLNEVVGGLGFTESDFSLPVTALSGGQKCRIALAKLLLRDQQLLLLDEPTNHLDIDAVRWLEKFLTGHHGGAVIISHDRYLLDRLADAIVEVENGRLNHYPGNYTNFVRVREVRRLSQERDYEKDREFIEKEQAFIAKHLAGQRSNEAKGRRTRLERRLKAGEFTIDRPNEQNRVKIELQAVETRATTVLSVDSLAKSYGDKHLFKDITFQVKAGESFGITGPNGTGKSTLLRIALGRVKADAGTATFDPRVKVGYYAQEADELDPQRSILTEIQTVRPDLREQGIRSMLGRFLFSGDDAFKPLGALSGGEQSRVRLLKLILSAPQVLVLDEPTNHLDIPSREVLEEALLEYTGTIIVVSHDRYFLDRIVERLLVIRPEGHEHVKGNYSTYLEQVEQRPARPAAATRDKPQQKSDKSESKSSKPRRQDGKNEGKHAGNNDGKHAGKKDAKQDGKKSGKKNAPARPRSAYDRMALGELEKFIIQQEQKIATANARFGEPSAYKDAAAITRLREELDGLKRELREAEQAWGEKVAEA